MAQLFHHPLAPFVFVAVLAALVIMYMHVERRMHRRFDRDRYNRTKELVLGFIQKQKQYYTMRELASAMGVPQDVMTRILNALVREKRLQRTNDSYTFLYGIPPATSSQKAA